jgi:hypothetical protein
MLPSSHPRIFLARMLRSHDRWHDASGTNMYSGVEARYRSSRCLPSHVFGASLPHHQVQFAPPPLPRRKLSWKSAESASATWCPFFIQRRTWLPARAASYSHRLLVLALDSIIFPKYDQSAALRWLYLISSKTRWPLSARGPSFMGRA